MARLPQIGDNDDAMVDLLTIIAQNTGGLGHLGDAIGGDEFHIHGNLDENGNPIYTTTGPGGMFIEDEDGWVEIEFGFTARIVNLRFDAPLLVGFQRPHNEANKQIPLDPDTDSPFTIGTDEGIRAPRMWLRLHTEAIEVLPDGELKVEYESGALVHLIAKA